MAAPTDPHRGLAPAGRPGDVRITHPRTCTLRDPPDRGGQRRYDARPHRRSDQHCLPAEGRTGDPRPALTLISHRLFDFVILAVLAIAGLSFIGKQVIPESRNHQQGPSWAVCSRFGGADCFDPGFKSSPQWTSRIIQKVLPRRWYDTLNELWLAKDAEKSPEHPLRRDVKTFIYVLLASLLSFTFLFLRGHSRRGRYPSISACHTWQPQWPSPPCCSRFQSAM